MEINNAQLTRDYNEIRREIDILNAGGQNSWGISLPSATSDITIFGVPLSIRDSLEIRAEKVFGVLRLVGLAGDNLENRSLDKKSNLNTRRIPGLTDSPLTSDTPSSESFIAQSKSHSIKEYILNKKRAKGQLTISNVFHLDLQGSIFVSVFLPPALYELLRLAESRAIYLGYNYVWSHSRKVFVPKKDD